MMTEECLSREELFNLVIDSEKFEGEYFRKVMKFNNITDDLERKKYGEIYAQSLSIINYLLVSDEKVSHYTKKTVAQKLMFDKEAKFRLNMAVLSNDSKEGKALFDYLGIGFEPLLKKATKESMCILGTSCFELVELNDKEQYGAFVGCFSFNTDSLNQFRLYGKEDNVEGTGVSMVFRNTFFTPKSSTNTNNRLYRCIYFDFETGQVVSVGHQAEYIRTKEKDSDCKIAKWAGQPRSIITEIKKDEEYSNEIKSIIDNVQKALDSLKEKIKEPYIDKNIVGQLLINLQYLIKDVAFKEEQECRIVSIFSLRDNKVKYSEDYNKLYVEAGLCNNHSIEKIIFGPKATGITLFQNMLWKDKIAINCIQSLLPLA